MDEGVEESTWGPFSIQLLSKKVESAAPEPHGTSLRHSAQHRSSGRNGPSLSPVQMRLPAFSTPAVVVRGRLHYQSPQVTIAR
jgi:hypothetical protein